MDFPDIHDEINDVIAAVQVAEKTKVSLELTKQGVQLFSPIELNRRFTEQFRARGFVELKDRYTISIPGYPVQIRGAFKQIDFAKRG